MERLTDLEAIAEKIKNEMVGEIREELREFKANVRGQLEGMQKQFDEFRIAIEGMKRMDSIERRIESMEKRNLLIKTCFDWSRLDETNARINVLTSE